MCVCIYTPKNLISPNRSPVFRSPSSWERIWKSASIFEDNYLPGTTFPTRNNWLFQSGKISNKRSSHRETNTYFWFFGVPGYDQGVIVLHKTLGLAELRGQPVRPSAAQPQSNPSLRHFLGIVAHAFPKFQLFLIKAAGRKTAWLSVQIEEPNSCAQAIWLYPATWDFWIWLISD